MTTLQLHSLLTVFVFCRADIFDCLQTLGHDESVAFLKPTTRSLCNQDLSEPTVREPTALQRFKKQQPLLFKQFADCH